MSPLDVSIVVLFLGITLYIGLRSGKDIHTFKDYAIGNQKFSDFAIFCTLAASCIGGSITMGCVGKTYAEGIAQGIVQLGIPASFLIMAFFLAPRFSYYYGCYSLGDLFAQAYGKTGKIMAGLTGFLYETFVSCMQFMAMGTTLNLLTGFSYIPCLWISAGIVFLYTGKGGIRGVTFTDVFQFTLLIVAIPLVLVIVLNKIGGIPSLFEALPITHKTITGNMLHRYLFLMLPFLLPTLSPIYVQRFLMTQNRYQGIKASIKLVWVCFFVAFISVGLGLCARVLLPNLTKADNAMVSLIQTYLPVGIYGFVVAGILAVLMSTVDSVLNSGSILLVNDIILPCLNRNISDKSKLRMSRISSWLVGILAVILASNHSDIFEIRVLTKTLWLTVILTPLYFLLFNLKISLKGLFISTAVGLTTVLFWNFSVKPMTKIDGLFPGLFANFFSITFFYFLGGRQKVFSKEQLQQKDGFEISHKEQTHFDERAFIAKNNVFLGIFLIFMQMIPLIFEGKAISATRMALILFNGTLSILLVFSPAFEGFKHKKSLSHIQFITLLFCLPFTCLYLLFTTEVNGIHLITLGMSLLIMVLISGGKSHNKVLWGCLILIALTCLGFMGLHKAILWPETFQGYHLFYLLGFIALLLLLRFNMQTLMREKELAVACERYKIAKSISHDLMTPLMVLEMILKKDLHKITPHENELLQNALDEMVHIVDSIVPSSQDPEDLPLVNLNDRIVVCLQKQQFLHKTLNIEFNSEAQLEAHVDASLFERIFYNVLQPFVRLSASFKEIPINIKVFKDENANGLIKIFHPNLSLKMLQQIFTSNDTLSDECYLGASFYEMQETLFHWNISLQLIKNENAPGVHFVLNTPK